jgi:hypothetical protein
MEKEQKWWARRREVFASFQALIATLDNEKRTLEREWAEFEETISPDPQNLAASLAQEKARLISRGLEETAFQDLEDTLETLQILRRFADRKEAEAKQEAEAFYEKLGRIKAAAERSITTKTND